MAVEPCLFEFLIGIDQIGIHSAPVAKPSIYSEVVTGVLGGMRVACSLL
jgi:hypothetical protein